MVQSNFQYPLNLAPPNGIATGEVTGSGLLNANLLPLQLENVKSIENEFIFVEKNQSNSLNVSAKNSIIFQMHCFDQQKISRINVANSNNPILESVTEREGYVFEISENSFSAYLANVNESGNAPTGFATFYINELSPDDQKKLQLGIVIRWTKGLEIYPNNRRQRVSRVTLYDMPKISTQDITDAYKKAKDFRTTKRVTPTPKLISWACKRSRIEREILEKKFKLLPQWESGTVNPTEKQLQRFAKTVHVPYGFLFLSKPPKESMPIKDFRSMSSVPSAEPSPDLLDVIYATQNQQEWYKEFAESEENSINELVGSTTTIDSSTQQAKKIRTILDYDLNQNTDKIMKVGQLRYLIDSIEEQGILVMMSRFANNNRQRTLNVNEFRGYTLCDPIAPLIFVNANDSETELMFALIHELAHILLGTTGLSNTGLKLDKQVNQNELWCNQFAAEFLVPTEDFQELLNESESLEVQLIHLEKHFKVSKLVVLRRLFDLKVILREEFDRKWQSEFKRQIQKVKMKSNGEHFITSILNRVGKRFAFALIISTLEGQTLYRDAFRMLGITKTETFNKIAESLGINI